MFIQFCQLSLKLLRMKLYDLDAMQCYNEGKITKSCHIVLLGLPGGPVGKILPVDKMRRFNPWMGKIPHAARGEKKTNSQTNKTN